MTDTMARKNTLRIVPECTEPTPERKTRKKHGPRARVLNLDNEVFFDVKGASNYLGITEESVLLAVQQWHLAPARTLKNGSGLVFTHTDLMRFRFRQRKRKEEKAEKIRALDAVIVEDLSSGMHPVDVYLKHRADGAKLGTVVRLLRDLAQLGGIWVVEGPPGSYARWLERMGLMRFSFRDLRRVVEAILLDVHTNRVVHAKLAQIKSEKPTEGTEWQPTKLQNASPQAHGSVSVPQKASGPT